MTDDETGTPEPETAALLRAVAASGLPALHTLRPEEARKAFAYRVGMTNLVQEHVEEVVDIDIPARDGGRVRLRVYRQQSKGAAPLLLYFHGGGFVIGGVGTPDPLFWYLASLSNPALVFVDHRLAPRNPFPNARPAVVDAFVWGWAHA